MGTSARKQSAFKLPNIRDLGADAIHPDRVSATPDLGWELVLLLAAQQSSEYHPGFPYRPLLCHSARTGSSAFVLVGTSTFRRWGYTFGFGGVYPNSAAGQSSPLSLRLSCCGFDYSTKGKTESTIISFDRFIYEVREARTVESLCSRRISS